jgi:hypothetical protein
MYRACCFTRSLLPSPLPLWERVDARRQARRRVRGFARRNQQSFPIPTAGALARRYSRSAKHGNRVPKDHHHAVCHVHFPRADHHLLRRPTAAQKKQNPVSMVRPVPVDETSYLQGAASEVATRVLSRRRLRWREALWRRLSFASVHADAFPLTRPPTAATLSHKGRGRKRRLRHRSLRCHTIIMTGFSISILKAPINSAPSAPSMAR